MRPCMCQRLLFLLPMPARQGAARRLGSSTIVLLAIILVVTTAAGRPVLSARRSRLPARGHLLSRFAQPQDSGTARALPHCARPLRRRRPARRGTRAHTHFSAGWCVGLGVWLVGHPYWLWVNIMSASTNNQTCTHESKFDSKCWLYDKFVFVFCLTLAISGPRVLARPRAHLRLCAARVPVLQAARHTT